MLRRRTVAWGNVGGLVTFSMMSTLMFVLTLYFEETLGLCAFRTGLVCGVAGVLSAAAGAYAPEVIGRFGARRTLVGSLVGQGARRADRGAVGPEQQRPVGVARHGCRLPGVRVPPRRDRFLRSDGHVRCGRRGAGPATGLVTSTR
jgi:hypothetical protein